LILAESETNRSGTSMWPAHNGRVRELHVSGHLRHRAPPLADLPTNVIRCAVVENAVLHARSLCEIFLCSGQEDSISLKRLFPDFDTNIEKYRTLRQK